MLRQPDGAVPAVFEHQDEEEGAPSAAVQEERAGPAELNGADEALLHLYYQRRDIKSSLLDGFLNLGRMPERVTFTSATQFFKYIDSLPGANLGIGLHVIARHR